MDGVAVRSTAITHLDDASSASRATHCFTRSNDGFINGLAGLSSGAYVSNVSLILLGNVNDFRNHPLRVAHNCIRHPGVCALRCCRCCRLDINVVMICRSRWHDKLHHLITRAFVLAFHTLVAPATAGARASSWTARGAPWSTWTRTVRLRRTIERWASSCERTSPAPSSSSRRTGRRQP